MIPPPLPPSGSAAEASHSMQYPLVASNPVAVLTALVAPAILTNACSVLALGTSNRLGSVEHQA